MHLAALTTGGALLAACALVGAPQATDAGATAASTALTTLGIFVFMANWNDLLGPVLYSTKAKMTLTIGLAMLFHQWGATPWNLVMAGSVVMVLPILLIYALGQKYFVQGIVTTGLKF